MQSSFYSLPLDNKIPKSIFIFGNPDVVSDLSPGPREAAYSFWARLSFEQRLYLG
jgi:hypothetical protein